MIKRKKIAEDDDVIPEGQTTSVPNRLGVFGDVLVKSTSLPACGTQKASAATAVMACQSKQIVANCYAIIGKCLADFCPAASVANDTVL